MGFVAYRVGYRWIYWILAITNLVQFVGYLFGGPETRYLRQNVEHRGSAFKQEYLNFRRLDPKPLRAIEFIQPAFLARYTSIVIPAVAYAITFGFCSVFLTVEIPQIFIPKFEFNPQQLGLQFLGIIIGSIIGEQLGGPLSDWWMKRKQRQLGPGARPHPEHRLVMSYFGFALAMAGLIIFGVRTEQAAHLKWNVTPIIGIAIAACGNQIITTILITYAVDSHPEQSSSIGVFVNLIRNPWGFIGPFWYPDMINSIGMSGSGGLMAGIIFACAVVPTAILQLRGGPWRERRTARDDTGEPTRGD